MVPRLFFSFLSPLVVFFFFKYHPAFTGFGSKMLFQGAAWEAGGSARPSGTVLSAREQGQILPPSLSLCSSGAASANGEKVYSGFSSKRHSRLRLGESRGTRWDEQHKASPRWEQALASPQHSLQRVNGWLLSYLFFFNFLNPVSRSGHLFFRTQSCKATMMLCKDGRTGQPCLHPPSPNRSREATLQSCSRGYHRHRDGIGDTIPLFHRG